MTAVISPRNASNNVCGVVDAFDGDKNASSATAWCKDSEGVLVWRTQPDNRQQQLARSAEPATSSMLDS